MRLRSIRYKDGRAPVRVLYNGMSDGFRDEPENFRGTLMRHAKQISEASPDEHLDGFIVIGLFEDGTRSLGFRLPKRIPRELIPSYIAEMIRTDVVVDNAAEEVFDSRFQWVDK